MTAELPLKERIQFLLLFGGLARESGRYALAVERLTRAGKELEEATFPGVASFPGTPDPFRDPGVPPAPDRKAAVAPAGDGFHGAAVWRRRSGPMRWSFWSACSWRTGPSPGPRRRRRTAGVRFLTPAEIVEVVRRIEEVALDGVDVDRFVEQLSANLNTLRNLSRPSMLSRYPDPGEEPMEGGDEIQVLWEEFRQRRSVAVDGIVSARDRDASLLLRDLWLYIKELGDDPVRLPGNVGDHAEITSASSGREGADGRGVGPVPPGRSGRRSPMPTDAWQNS